MGKQYPPLDRIQVETILKNAGFEPKRQTGSHVQWQAIVNDLRRIVTVPHLKKGKKEKYGHGLLASMIRQSGLSKEEFYSYLS